MHIVMLASTHPPTDARIFRKEAKTLVDAGHSVTILTMANGEYEVDFGVQFKLLSRPKNRYLRVLKGKKLAQRALELDADIYIIHDPEILYAGRWLARRGKKYVYDAHELYPDFITEKNWVPKPLKPIVRSLVAHEEMRGAESAAGLIVAMRENAERLAPSGKPILTLHNFPRLDDIAEKIGEKENSVIYVGGIMDVRFGKEMLAMAKYFAPSEILDGWRLEILGPVHRERYIEECLRVVKSHKNKEYLHFPAEYIPYNEALKKIERAKFGISLIRPTRKYRQCISGKVFDYMAKGTVPVTTWLPSYEGLVSEADGPVFVQPGEEERVPYIIADLAKDEAALRQRAERCIESCRTKFNWEREGKELPGFLERLVNT